MNTAWMEHRACGPEVQHLLFADDGSDTAAKHPDVVEAKAVCAGCEVRMHCLAYSLNGPVGRTHTYFVWGGLTYHERLLMYRRRFNRRRKAAWRQARREKVLA